MKLRKWPLATLVVSLLGCGASTDDARGFGQADQPATGTYQVGDQVDTNGDGMADGVAVDSDGDGVADGVDTNGDGTADAPLPNGPSTAGTGGTSNPSGTSGGTNTNDPNKCEEHAVRNDRVTPDMLIVLDKSGSMSPDSNDQGVDRWQGSVDGLKAITAELDDAINFGLMTFPLQSNQCGAGMMDVPIAPVNAGPIAAALDAMTPNGGTPTSLTLAAAHAELGAVTIDPDAVTASKYVLLVTDGAPNCLTTNPFGNCSPFDIQCLQMQLMDTAAVKATVEEITGMAGDGIKTYVIGYQTQGTSLASALDMMALAGDTGDTMHRPVEDENSLVNAFREIAGKAISCTFVLDEAPPDPSYVLVKIDGQQLNLDEADGWSLSADGKKVQVQGASCDRLQDGTEHLLTVDVACEIVQPI